MATEKECLRGVERRRSLRKNESSVGQIKNLQRLKVQVCLVAEATIEDLNARRDPKQSTPQRTPLEDVLDLALKEWDIIPFNPPSPPTAPLAQYPKTQSGPFNLEKAAGVVSSNSANLQTLRCENNNKVQPKSTVNWKIISFFS